jgi:hypothetical protein
MLVAPRIDPSRDRPLSSLARLTRWREALPEDRTGSTLQNFHDATFVPALERCELWTPRAGDLPT